ncbi:MAG: class I SAM-dependent methyltransferase [Bacteroidota bacterium]
MGRNEVTSTWQGIWRDRKDRLAAPGAPSPIFHALREIAGSLGGKSVLEPGSGIGEISIHMAREGAKVVLLDISPDALELSRRFFRERGLQAEFVLGDIFRMPFPENRFDIVWNAGVVEHFRPEDQVSALREFARVAKPGGLVITFNPNARARLYRWGKRVGEERGTWEFGEEYPVESMDAAASASGLVLEREFSIFFERSISFLRYVSPLVFRLVKAAYVLSGGNRNPLWQRLLGGYLLASVMRKP